MSNISNRALILILISASLIVWYMHVRGIDIPKKAERRALHAQIINQQAPSPYRYRLLVPVLAEGTAAILNPLLGRENAVFAAYALLEMLAVVGLALMLHALFVAFFDPPAAAAGALFANLSMVVAMRDHYFQPWSPVCALLFAAAALLLYKNKTALFAVLVAVGALTRETTVLLVPMYFFIFAGKDNYRSTALRSLLLLMMWSGIYMTVRNFQGSAPYVHQISDILSKNLEGRNLFIAAVNITLFMGIFWVFIFKGFYRAPPFIRRLALYVPFYMVLFLVFGVWKEVRLLMPLYPVLIPLGLSYLFTPKTAPPV